jgi:hypothetical protein
MNDKEFEKIIVELSKASVSQIKSLKEQFKTVFEEDEETEEQPTPVLSERFFLAESITSESIYEKIEYREVEQIGFYIRPAREWFYPCPTCQKRLKQTLAQARWIFGNHDYEPAIEMSNVKNELDEDYTRTIEKHPATKNELERIGVDGWEKLNYIPKPTK